MRSTNKVSVQKISQDTYRISARQGRSAITGRFVTSPAKKSAATTYRETPKKG